MGKRQDQGQPHECQGDPRPRDTKRDHKKSQSEPSQEQESSTCITGVNPSRKHGIGPLGGARVVWGVRIDEDLKNRVQPKLRHLYGSDCRAFESWLMAFEVSYDEMIKQREATVNPGHTSITIEELNVVRAQAPRRKLDVSDPIGYTVDENTIVQETVNRFKERHELYGAIPNRMAILKHIRHAHPEIDGKTRIALTTMILRHLGRASTSS